MPGGLAPPPGPAEAGAETARSDGDPKAALLRGVLLPAVIAIVIGTVFVAVFLAAFHDPVPRDLPVGVVGSEQQVDQVRQAFAEQAPGRFAVSAVPDEAAAEDAVRHRDLYGVLVLGGGPPQLLTAGANGQGVAATLTGAFTPVAQQAGQQLQVQDLVPLADGDTRGLAIFYAAFGVVLGGFLFGIVSFQVAPKLPLRWRVLSVVLFGVVSGLAVALLADTGFGSVPAPFAEAALVVGLLATAIAATAAFVLRLIGAAGTFVTSVGLLVFGNATSTGNLPAEYLPSWMEPLAHVLPPGVAVRALRGASYFADDGVVPAVWVLAAWTVVPLLLIAVLDATGRRRARPAGA